MKTGLITSDTYQNHNTGDGHPEKIDRVTVVIDNFKKLDNKNLIWKKPSKFDRSLLEITHNSDYINFVEKSFPEKGLSFLDGDTIVSPGSKDATSDAVGSIITAIDGVQNKDFKNKSLDRKKYLKEIQKPDHIGINAFSIAEITGIPRATVVRKLQFLIKNKFLNLDEKKLYTFGIGVQSKQFKVISKLQDSNMNALSKFLYRVFNQIKVINSN